MFTISSRTHRFGAWAFAFVITYAACTHLALAQDTPKPEDAPKDTTNYKELKSPIPYSEASIKKARTIYMRLCTSCHGPDGKAQIDVIADASDLTNPKLYRNGITEGEIFKSIKVGAGVSMPPFKDQIKTDEDMWHLVNFTRSLWPKDQRPALEETKEATDTESKDGESSNDGE